jgi:hypothetical protein
MSLNAARSGTSLNLKDFPKVKLSYETFVHKKVDSADVTVVIPQGKKCFAWLRDGKCHFVFNSNTTKESTSLPSNPLPNLLRTIDLPNTNNFNNTVFYGTLFKECFFSIQDILYYRGKVCYTQDRTFANLVKIYTGTLSPFLEDAYKRTKDVLFGLPITYDGCVSININEIPYLVESVQYRYFEKALIHKLQLRTQGARIEQKPFSKESPQINIKKRVFKVIPDLQNDIYHLHDVNNMPMAEQLIAYIPDYKTSVFMNKLFRRIKENINLDALEESDSDEEFENEKVDKFVHLDVEKNMLCEFHLKFKKWVPIKVV